MTVPTYLPYVVLTGNALTLIAILYGLNRALADARGLRKSACALSDSRLRFFSAGSPSHSASPARTSFM
jgi:hypothetical protein